MKIINYIIALLIAGTIISCDSYLDVVPDNVATIENAFSDKYNAEKYLFTCYSYLPDFASRYSNPAIAGGDDIWFSEYHKDASPVQLAKGFQNITNVRFNAWNGGLFVGIRDCNTFLEKVGTVRDMQQYEKRQWSAEAKFLKAYYHYYLIRMYGPIPIIRDSKAVSSGTEAIKVSREPVDSCFAYVVDLLDEAIADLPETLMNPLTSLGRITKPIAMAVKAEVLMTAASPLFNGNQVHSTLANKDGQLLFNPTFDETKWEKAAAACKDAIDMAEANQISLYQKSDFVTSFTMSDTTKHIAALRSAVTERWNKELIWGSTQSTSFSIQYDASPRWYAYISNPAGSNMSPTLKVAEEFYSENGVPINEDKTWAYDDRYKLKTAGQEDWLFVEPNEQTVGLNFDRELRYYSSISFDRGAWFGNGSPQNPEEPWYIRNRRGEFASIFEIANFSITGLYPKKLVNIENEVRDGQNYYAEDYAFPIIRLADLYLYYAEALNEVKASPDAEVYEYIDKVRERAGLNGVVESWSAYSTIPNKPTTKTGMRDIIQRERLIELAFEGHRFWDLRRWMLAKRYLNAPVLGFNVQKNDPKEYYHVLTLYNQTFTERDYFWPIAEYETVRNPNLVQNIGW
ncbi:RagB/SusD family nutrient uptake outer membrane protein [Sunxiuqinia sp. A32]|uniref:RagB/SusD family nutrient uptake outer membrane protein n=1 Tax=Sunxiuqinia sp. A32 TaxID=3461496 RepID=UPI004046346B